MSYTSLEMNIHTGVLRDQYGKSLEVISMKREFRDLFIGVARTLKSYAHQMETTASSKDSLQLCSFSKWELHLKEKICSQREQILSFKSSSLRYGNHFYHIRRPPLSVTIFITHSCIMRNRSYAIAFYKLF